MIDREREAVWHYLCSLNNIGLATISHLLEYTGDLMEICELDTPELEQAGFFTMPMLAEWDRAREFRERHIQRYDELENKSYRFISAEHPDFPGRLKNIPQAPYGIWVKGRLPAEEMHTSAIIGSRICTDYGYDVARSLGRKLAGIGVGVISGMAMGVDAAGHLGALDNKGYTLAVLGCGIDICYPMQNIELYDRLIREGGIITEYSPGCPGHAQNFRARNRIISGMSECVIVAEARKKSGTQLTVSWALDQGRDIFVVPGRITDNYSMGCNEMIYQGATILHDFSVLKEYFGDDAINDTEVVETSFTLSATEKLVYDKMTFQLQHFENLLFKTNLTTGLLWQTVYSLESKKLISQPVKNFFKKTYN